VAVSGEVSSQSWLPTACKFARRICNRITWASTARATHIQVSKCEWSLRRVQQPMQGVRFNREFK
jgi:hypothetical protein